MGEAPLICAFAKLRNEVLREGNVYRLLEDLRQYCDAGVLCDDASSDGTDQVLAAFVDERRRRGQAWELVRVPRGAQAFQRELEVKNAMMASVHRIAPVWVFWMDGDEVLSRRGGQELRAFVRVAPGTVQAYRFHYTQPWRNTSWARTDDGFDAGSFIKLWRWRPDLSFDARDGLHHAQFPQQLMAHLGPAECPEAPYEIVHYGNVGVNLRWKVIQYHDAEISVKRHLRFEQASYRPVDDDLLPPHAERLPGSQPNPYTVDEVATILSLRGLRKLPGWFTVVIPAYNRADTLPKALESVRRQTYQQWVAVVLDDGSTDSTREVVERYVERDPRIFSARYPTNRGGVAMNEIGMAMACEWTEYWARLGSDDWWEPRKLEYDVRALLESNAGAVYGPYVVSRRGVNQELCNAPMAPAEVRQALHGPRGFVASWANCAIRTAVLEQVRAKYGTFVDPGLRNMEDFLLNARVARFTDFVWRGEAGGLVIATDEPGLQVARRVWPGMVRWDATWRCVETGASGDVSQTVSEDALTRKIVQHENGGGVWGA